jgi:hypothetical protein
MGPYGHNRLFTGDLMLLDGKHDRRPNKELKFHSVSNREENFFQHQERNEDVFECQIGNSLIFVSQQTSLIDESAETGGGCATPRRTAFGLFGLRLSECDGTMSTSSGIHFLIHEIFR